RGFLSARPVRAATPHGADSIRRAIVSIRATRAGRDFPSLILQVTHVQFLSARPVRAATNAVGGGPQPGGRFYPRDPCGPRPGVRVAGVAVLLVSIRATRAGRDLR